MKEIVGLKGLVSEILEVGIKPLSIAITEGCVSMRHGMWLVTNPEIGVLHEGYGLNTLADMLVDKPETLGGKDSVVKYLTLGVDQEESTVFGVHYSEEQEEMIRMKTKLSTTVGSRQVCGDGCDTNHDTPCSKEHCDENITQETVDVETIGSEDNSAEEDNKESNTNPEGETTPEVTEEEGSDNQEVSTEQSVVIEDTSIEETTEDNKPDFEHAESLYNSEDKSGSKVALESYAREFDVELSRGKTFENMMIDFKEAFNE